MVICVWNLTLIYACGIDADIKKCNVFFKIKYHKCSLDMWHKFITNLQCNELIMSIMWDRPFIRFVHFTHVENAFDTWINVLRNEIWTYEWTHIAWNLHFLINPCVKYVFNAPYQCVKSTNIEWTNSMCSIIKLWKVKFVMLYILLFLKIYIVDDVL